MAEALETWEHVNPDGSGTWPEWRLVADDDSILHKAAYNGDIARLVLALDEIDDVDNSVCKEHCSPLHLAVQSNQAEAVRVLLAAGADPKAQISLCCSTIPRVANAVEAAAWFGSHEALMALISHGIKIPDNTLYLAATSNQVSCMRAILSKWQKDLASEKDILTSARIALKCAAAELCEEAVEFLLTSIPGFPNANLKKDRMVLTDAMLAMLSQLGDEGCRRWDAKVDARTQPILELFIAAGAEIDSRAFWASLPVQNNIVRVLLDHGLEVNDTRNWDQFYSCEDPTKGGHMILAIMSANGDDPSILQDFLAQGADATIKDEHLNTLLHLSAHKSYAKLLLEHGADLNAKNSSGHTPLYAACESKRFDIVELLLSQGADVHEITKDDAWISLMRVVLRRPFIGLPKSFSVRRQMVDILLAHGANVNATADDGVTVLHEAVLHHDVALVHYLVERGANPRATTSSGQTLLHTLCFACPTTRVVSFSSHLALLDCVIDFGVEPNARDCTGLAALHGLLRDHSQQSWRPDMFNALLKRGADMNLKSETDWVEGQHDGRSPAEILDTTKWAFDNEGFLQAIPIPFQTTCPERTR